MKTAAQWREYVESWYPNGDVFGPDLVNPVLTDMEELERQVNEAQANVRYYKGQADYWCDELRAVKERNMQLACVAPLTPPYQNLLDRIKHLERVIGVSL